MQFLVGLLLAITIAYASWRLRTLSADGSVAAACLGTVVFGLGGWIWAALLLIFFVSSSALTHTFKNLKLPLSEGYSKSGRRDWRQVISNGGIAGLFVLLHLVFIQAVWPWLAYAAALAAVNADTWATELGVLDRNKPRLITNLGAAVERGTSGGISPVGMLAAILGSAAVAAPAAAFVNTDRWILFALITLSGFLGSLLDSLLGATLEGMYFCPTDARETEKYPLHTCGTPTVHIRGWRWFDNDCVNIACSAFGALVILPFASLLH